MNLFFICLILLIVFSCLMTISSFNPIHSVFWMVLVFLFIVGLLIFLDFEFIPLMIIIIYIGAITILFLFVIMMIDIIQLKSIKNINYLIPIIISTFSIIIIESWFLFKNDELLIIKNKFINFKYIYLSQIQCLSSTLYLDYYISFILISILLLIAMVGAIILTLERNILSKKQNLINQHHRNNSWIQS